MLTSTARKGIQSSLLFLEANAECSSWAFQYWGSVVHVRAQDRIGGAQKTRAIVWSWTTSVERFYGRNCFQVVTCCFKHVFLSTGWYDRVVLESTNTFKAWVSTVFNVKLFTHLCHWYYRILETQKKMYFLSYGIPFISINWQCLNACSSLNHQNYLDLIVTLKRLYTSCTTFLLPHILYTL